MKGVGFRGNPALFSSFFLFFLYYFVLLQGYFSTILMKKYCKDLVVKSVEHISAKNVLIRLTQADPLPEILPGQFVEIRVDHSPATFLRRPISIHFVDREANELWLMVAVVGEGTRQLATLREGDALNIVFPLGNGFTVSSGQSADATPLRCLLVGGGVGIAPLLELGNVYIIISKNKRLFLF